MIVKLPKANDPLKDEIEKVKKKLKYISTENNDNTETIQKLEQEALPKIKKEIEDLIENIKCDLLSCNPFQTLEYFSMKYSLTTKDNVLQDIDSLNSNYLEYLHNLITSLSEYDYDKEPTDEILERIEKNIEDLFQQTMFLFMIIATDKDGKPDKTRYLQMSNYLIIKGLSYSSHQTKLCKKLFSKYDDKIHQTFGINSNELIDGINELINCPIKNIESKGKYFSLMKKAHEDFIKKSEIAEKNGTIGTFMEDYKNSDALKKVQEELAELDSKLDNSFNDSTFKITNSKLSNSILELMSITIGENTVFKDGEMEYFPINDSLINQKPLIKVDNDYFIYNSTITSHNLHLIIEELLLNTIPANKQSKQYYKKKGDYLEEVSIELLQKMLPNSESYINLKYNQDDEVDGIIVYDNNIFIIEAKSNKFSLDAKKGSLDRIKRNTKDIVEKAYQQAIRAKNFLLTNDTAEFRDKNKRIVLSIKKEEINNIYLINTTLEPLMHITSNLNSLKKFGFIQNEDWIWSVYINDLRVISEIIDSPTEFLLYLERRIKFNDYPQIHSMEEIDIFGLFLDSGIYFEDIDFPETGYNMITHGYTEPIDKYFLSLEGNYHDKQTKPSFIKKSPIKNIIKQIETSQQTNFSKLSKFLLNFAGDIQDEILKQTNNILNGLRKNFSMAIEDKNLGFTIIHSNYSNIDDMIFYCKVLCYEKKLNNWFLISVDGQTINNIKVSFKYLTFDNSYNETLEKEVKELKERRMQQTLSIQKKIKRNDPCPCGSGKKFKKCCIHS